tara:strand:+ start:884 stop:1255 length:372 start_codon:yes stop_codon:yes gene_type:complete
MKTKAIIEVAGAPKEHIENVIKEIVEKIKNEKDIERFKIFEAQEKDKMFFTFTEIELNFKNFEEISGFCFDYFPSSIEILEENVDVKREELENTLNDLLAKLHQYDMDLKNLKAENIMLKKNT